MEEIFDKEYVVVDLETTGLDPKKGNEIIEIGVTEIEGDKIKRNYSRFVKPRGFIPTFITNLTRITNEMVENEKYIEDVLPKFREYIGNKTVIAHNAKFDINFLNHYLEKLNLPLIEKYICTMELLKVNTKYSAKNKKLNTACGFYNIDISGHHRADADTYATAQLFLKIRDDLND